MPAHIGILDTLKIPFAALAQLGPGKFSKATRGMGRSTPAELYAFQKKAVDKRNTRIPGYTQYRYYLNRFDPNKAAPVSPVPGQAGYSNAVDRNEWDLYLKPDTTFDSTIKAALAKHKTEGWEVCFVSQEGDDKTLKRIEIKRGKGNMSITLWSASDGANTQLF
jgi:hypothetical protein